MSLSSQPVTLACYDSALEVSLRLKTQEKNIFLLLMNGFQVTKHFM